jgi:hypothetical protein
MKDGELRRLFKNLVNCSPVSALAAPGCGGSTTTSHGENDLSGTGGETSSGTRSGRIFLSPISRRPSATPMLRVGSSSRMG